MKENCLAQRCRRCRRAVSVTLLSLVLLNASVARVRGLDAWDFAVEATAEVQTNPAQIRLAWTSSPFAASYAVSRKLMTEQSWQPLANLPGEAAGYTDRSVVLGAGYEYEIVRTTVDGVLGYGYLYAGIEVSFPTVRGRILLIVEASVAEALAPELTTLSTDLVGDGWLVSRHAVSRTARPEEVKALIQAEYQSDSANTKAVLLFGHVPVPYSGDINPDLHPAHRGAWPADAYYGDMTGEWSDSSVTSSGSEDPRNHNVPGDGKFDPSDLPGPVVLQVGRIDLDDLQPFTSQSELDLLRQYLHKNHRFRHRLFTAEPRGLIRDNFGEIEGDAPAADAWRTFTAFFGPEGIDEVGPGGFFPALTAGSYLWAYGGGGGEFYQVDTVGSTSDFLNQNPRCVFYMLHGSYFGDWDFPGNFLRAALATPEYGLAAAWTGLPHWFLHHMALGETIGLSTVVSQNNRGLYKNQVNLAAGQVHIALMGDPTLRMHVVAPPADLVATRLENGAVALTWAAAPEPVLGYYVYRAEAPEGPYSRMTRSFLTAVSYTDGSAPGGRATYMVRAVNLQSSSSGTYYNPSQGIFASINSGSGPPLPVVSVTASEAMLDESEAAGASFLIHRAGPSDLELRVALAVSGTASSGLDYEPISEEAVFPPNTASIMIAVQPIPDSVTEGDETVTLSISPGINYATGTPPSASIQILDAAVAQSPTLSSIPDQILWAGLQPKPIPVNLADPDTPLSALTLSARSSNPALVSEEGFSFSGSGTNRTLTIQPIVNQTGTASITLTVHDGALSATQTFAVTVLAGSRIASISRRSDGAVELVFEGSDVETYVVESSTDLQVWNRVGPGIAKTNQTQAFVDPQPATGVSRFYRLRQQ